MNTFVHRFSRTGFLAVIVALLALSIGAGLTLAKGKKHKVNATIRLTILDQSPTYPSPGSTVVNTGTIKSKGGAGSGAIIQNVTITGHPTATTYTFKGSATDFAARGTVKTTATGTATAHADGSVTITGKGRYKGGTGPYKKAKGKFTFSGSAPKPVTGKPNVLTVKTKGTISY